MKYLVFFLFLFLSQLSAELKLPAIFSHGMVLQQNMSTPVWGWGKEGDKVKVSFAGQVKRGKVDAEGNWMIKLNPMNANAKSQKMTIEVGGDKGKIVDILIGEVWLLSGQSNMDFDLKKISVDAREPKYQPIVETIREEAKKSDALLRQILVPHKTSYNKALNNFVGEWKHSNPENNDLFSATGFFFGQKLRAELNVPVGLIKAPWGGKPVESFVPPAAYMADPQLKAYYEKYMSDLDERIKKYDPEKTKAMYNKRIEKWKADVKKAKEAKKAAPRKPRYPEAPATSTSVTGTLYNAMIHPVSKYGIKGALWYQGESNAGRDPSEYRKRLQALITGWRNVWGQGDFPFYYCQLAGFRAPPTEPIADDGWVTVCDQMRLALNLENTGMAVLNDIGEETDIHPRNKIDAGYRLAYWALAKDYGRTDITYSGPLYESHEINGSKVTVTFSEVDTGLMVARKHLLNPAKEKAEKLGGFQIVGKDGNWKWAEAEIVSKNQVVVSHPSISAPVEVRYAWAANPTKANLYNKAGLPTSVFSTLTK